MHIEKESQSRDKSLGPQNDREEAHSCCSLGLEAISRGCCFSWRGQREVKTVLTADGPFLSKGVASQCVEFLVERTCLRGVAADRRSATIHRCEDYNPLVSVHQV